MAQTKVDNLKINAPKIVDSRYYKDGISTPYSSKQDAFDSILYKSKKLPFVVLINGIETECWFKDGVSSVNDIVPTRASIFSDGISGVRNGNVLEGILDVYTGEHTTYSKVTIFYDGTDMDDSKVDDVIYKKFGTEYFRRNVVSNFFNLRWFGIVGTTNDTSVFQKAMNTISTIGGGTLYIPYIGRPYKLTGIDLQYGVSILAESYLVTLEAIASSRTGFFMMPGGLVQQVSYSRFTVDGKNLNVGQHGWDIIAANVPALNTGGMWYSVFDAVTVQNFNGGKCYNFKCFDPIGGQDLANQFLTFYDCKFYAGAATGSGCIYAEGQFGQVYFYGTCDFTGSGVTSGNKMIDLKSHPASSGSDNVYTIVFDGTTIQAGYIGLQSFFASNVSFRNCHFEQVAQCFNVTDSSDLVVNQCTFSLCGTNAPGYTSGGGWVANIVGGELSFDDNVVFLCGNTHIVGNTNTSRLLSCVGNKVDGGGTNLKVVGFVPHFHADEYTNKIQTRSNLQIKSTTNVALVNPGDILKSIEFWKHEGANLSAQIDFRAADYGNIYQDSDIGIQVSQGGNIATKFILRGDGQMLGGNGTLSNAYITKSQFDNAPQLVTDASGTYLPIQFSRIGQLNGTPFMRHYRWNGTGVSYYAAGFELIGDVLTLRNAASAAPIGSEVMQDLLSFTRISRDATFAATVAGANATASNHFVTKSQLDSKTLAVTGTLDFPSTAAQTSSELTVTVTGAVVGDTALVNSTVNPANTQWSAYVSASNTVTVRLNNYSASAVDPASGTFYVKVIK